MALQGDLASFALPDVLRLLAGTAKTGRLTIEGSPHTGEVWFREGEIAGGTVTSRPSASAAAEIVYELLQFDQGSFAFDDDDVVEGSDSAEVEGALAEAERLQAEWDDVTQVVPSLDHWLEMTPELATGEVTLDGDQWRLLAVIAGGAPVQTVAKQFSESDLAASKRVKAMAESGLVTVSEPRSVVATDSWTEHRGEELILDEGDDFDEETEGDLVHLSAEEGPVVLETSEDALLPEPLPGEGTSFTAEAGEVDAAAFHVDAPDAPLAGADAEGASEDAFAAPSIDNAPEADAGDPALAWDALAGDTSEIGTSEEAFRAVGWDENPPVDHLDGDKDDDPDRSSLLKFLSSVKP
ncbi:MAG: DUF4388 domain-containing protein [Acidimicrobiales bacterium]|nr:DUF4388 domain-containing protein [Acidimicrobiales bacterium]